METGKTQTHHILLFGMTGGTGKLIAERLLSQGHRVTAVGCHPAKVTLQHPHLAVRKGDITQPGTFTELMAACDVAISAIGDHSRKPTTLYSGGIKNVITAMTSSNVGRLICISAQPVEISPAIPFWQKWLIKYILQKIFRYSYADLRAMEKIVCASELNWTIMRPPRLKNNPPTGKYRLAINGHLKLPFSISRADLANCICDLIDQPETFRSIIEIAY
jgi:putative NADH-flavin reductase